MKTHCEGRAATLQNGGTKAKPAATRTGLGAARKEKGLV